MNEVNYNKWKQFHASDKCIKRGCEGCKYADKFGDYEKKGCKQ